jgi:hypothetical protein
MNVTPGKQEKEKIKENNPRKFIKKIKKNRATPKIKKGGILKLKNLFKFLIHVLKKIILREFNKNLKFINLTNKSINNIKITPLRK